FPPIPPSPPEPPSPPSPPIFPKIESNLFDRTEVIFLMTFSNLSKLIIVLVVVFVVVLVVVLVMFVLFSVELVDVLVLVEVLVLSLLAVFLGGEPVTGSGVAVSDDGLFGSLVGGGGFVPQS